MAASHTRAMQNAAIAKPAEERWRLRRSSFARRIEPEVRAISAKALATRIILRLCDKRMVAQLTTATASQPVLFKMRTWGGTGIPLQVKVIGW